MYKCICITESLDGTPEISTMLLIAYAPIWNKNLKNLLSKKQIEDHAWLLIPLDVLLFLAKFQRILYTQE